MCSGEKVSHIDFTLQVLSEKKYTFLSAYKVETTLIKCSWNEV